MQLDTPWVPEVSLPVLPFLELMASCFVKTLWHVASWRYMRNLWSYFKVLHTCWSVRIFPIKKSCFMGSPACLPTNLEFVTWKFGKCLTSSDHLKNLPNILLSRHVWWHYRSPCLSPWTCSSPGIVPLQRQAGWQKASHKEECVDGWMHAFDVFRTRWNNISIEAGKGEDYYSGINILCWQIQIFAIERQETSFNMPLIRQKSRRLCRCNIEPRH